MKYGETLRQRSIPAWSHYNIDYDDIKGFIKDHTTPGKGKNISVPGRGDEKLLEFESDLFQIFADQHQRIDLFVNSKTGEIRRRIDHAKKQFRQLSGRRHSVVDQRIPIARLDRYVRLENDVVKAGDELRSLARFTSAQRTAFRKLLKKYKKWTGSTRLVDRVREEILDDPRSFTNLDFGSMLDDYSDTLQDIRCLYENRPGQSALNGKTSDTSLSLVGSSIEGLRSALASKSKVDFDVAFDTIPLGENAKLASYFVHPENIIELQIFLLQHLQYFTLRSRMSSSTTPIPSSPSLSNAGNDLPRQSDYCILAADHPDRFAQKQASITVDEREESSGTIPQRAKVCIRWNVEEDPVLSARAGQSRARLFPLKRKHIDAFFDRQARLSERKLSIPNEGTQDIEALRKELFQDSSFRQLYQISTCRSRFVSIDKDSKPFLLGTLDAGIVMCSADGKDTSNFPFALLQIRQEGKSTVDLISILDQSHLVERVRGFSLQFHALCQITKPENISPPFWMPILSRDIRKLPPPAMPRDSASNSPSTTQPSSSNSVMGATDSTTAVETARPSSTDAPDEIEVPSLQAFRKKSRRQRFDPVVAAPQQRYWSEYDHPEDGEGDGGYVILIDPNERSTFDRLFDRFTSLFGKSSNNDGANAHIKDEESSSSEDERAPLRRSSATATNQTNYGAVGPLTSTIPSNPLYHPTTTIVQPLAPTLICLGASLIILAIASFLTATSRRRFLREVDVAVVFAIVAALLFAAFAVVALVRRPRVPVALWSTASAVLLLEAVWSGGLLAWVLG